MAVEPNPFLDAVIKEMDEKGEVPVLTDRAHDREFCRMVGVDYTAEDVYTQIKGKVEAYRRLQQNEEGTGN